MIYVDLSRHVVYIFVQIVQTIPANAHGFSEKELDQFSHRPYDLIAFNKAPRSGAQY
jgi:hypothetical protein